MTLNINIEGARYTALSVLATSAGRWVPVSELRRSIEQVALLTDDPQLAEETHRAQGDEVRAVATLSRKAVDSICRARKNSESWVDVKTVPVGSGGKTERVAVRMKVSTAKRWRTPVSEKFADAPLLELPDGFGGKTPNKYAEFECDGLTETEAWELVPLRQSHTVSFDASHINWEQLKLLLPVGAVVEPVHGKHTRIRVPFGAGGYTRRAVLTAIALQGAPASSVKNLKVSVTARRDLAELPASFLRGFYDFYLPILIGRVKANHSSTFGVFGEYGDDVEAQVALWLTEIAATFDARRSSFGPYAMTKIANKVRDFARDRSGGRHINDKEIRLSRAERAVSVDGEFSCDDDVARELGVPVAELMKLRNEVSAARAVRSPGSLDAIATNSDGESSTFDLASVVVDAGEHCDASSDAMAMLSEASWALVDAVAPNDPACPPHAVPVNSAGHGVATPNLIGLLGVLRESQSGVPREKLAHDLDISTRTLNRLTDQVHGQVNGTYTPQTWAQKRSITDGQMVMNARAVDQGVAGLWLNQQRMLFGPPVGRAARELGMSAAHAKDLMSSVKKKS